MAIKLNITQECETFVKTDYGILETENAQMSFNDIYVKVESVNGSKEKVSLFVSLSLGENKMTQNYSFVPSVEDGSKNFIAQAYEYLKTLPEFADATDC